MKTKTKLDPLKDFPRFHHIGARKPPAELISEFSRTYRRLVRDRDPELFRHLKEADLGLMQVRIVEAMDAARVRQYCPPWGCAGAIGRLSCRNTAIEWQCLESSIVGGQRVYHWPGQGKLSLSVHALERLFERIAGLRNNLAIMTGHRYLSPRDTQLERCAGGYWVWTRIGFANLIAILGFEQAIAHSREYLTRAAFVPVVQEGSREIAKTVLSPAMRVPGFDADRVDVDRLKAIDDDAMEAMRELHRRLPMIKRVALPAKVVL